MLYIIGAFIFIIGLFVGSFLKVLIDRIPRGESPFLGRSHCDNCNKTLQWFELIPLLSFLFSRGKCRHCKVKLSWHYFMIEVLTGVLFACTFLHVGNLDSIESFSYISTLLYSFFIIASFIVIFFIDLTYGIIPNAIVYPGTIISFMYLLVTASHMLLLYIISAIGAFAFFFFLFAVTKGRGMGFGDVKLAFLLGLFLGFPNIIIALYIAFLTGAIVALILVIGKKKKFSGGTIPFGPFLIIGALIAFFYGPMLLGYIHYVF